MTARPGVRKNDRLALIALARRPRDFVSNELVNDSQLVPLISENEVALDRHRAFFKLDELCTKLVSECVWVPDGCRKVNTL